MWKDSYRIGDDQIDQQHRQLILTLEKLLECLHSAPEELTDTCKHTVDYLKSFVVVHFGAEEMLQREIGFPDQERHKKLHEDFAARLREQEFELMRTDYGRPAMEKLAEMLTKWWIWHIVKEDTKMLPYIQDRQAAPSTNHSASPQYT